MEPGETLVSILDVYDEAARNTNDGQDLSPYATLLHFQRLISMTMLRRRAAASKQLCAECGCDIDGEAHVVHAGKPYCSRCGYELIERLKGSADRRPL